MGVSCYSRFLPHFENMKIRLIWGSKLPPDFGVHPVMGWWPGQASIFQYFFNTISTVSKSQKEMIPLYIRTSTLMDPVSWCVSSAYTRVRADAWNFTYAFRKKKEKKTHPHSPRIILSQLHNALPNVRLYWGQSSNERHALPAAVLVTLAVNSPSTSVSWCRLVALRSPSNEALWPPMWL